MILIDTREQYKQEIQEKLTKLNVPSIITKLEDYTDYVLVSDNEEVENIVAIQRKTIAEVLSKESSKQGYKSMMDEIRDRIVNETKAKYEDTWLLVEDGGLRVSADAKILIVQNRLLHEKGISIKSYYNFLHSLEDKAISIKTVPNLEYSIWWLYSTHSYIQKHHYPKPARKYSEPEEIIGVLMGIKEIGEKKALQIYETYQSSTHRRKKVVDEGITLIDTKDFVQRDYIKGRGKMHYLEERFSSNRKEYIRLRNIIIKRDKRECQYCLRKLQKHEYEIHHIIPFNECGGNEEWNLILLCSTCHDKIEGKGLSMDEIKRGLIPFDEEESNSGDVVKSDDDYEALAEEIEREFEND